MHTIAQNISLEILYQCRGDAKAARALALLIKVRDKINWNYCLNDFSINKIHSLTGASPNAIKKYIAKLKSMGLIFFVNKKNHTLPSLYFRKIKKKTKHRNVSLYKVITPDAKLTVVAEQLYSLIVGIQLHRKTFIKRLLRKRNNPFKLPKRKLKEDFKCVKKDCRKFAMPNLDGSYEYHDWGNSILFFSVLMGCSPRTAWSRINKMCHRKLIYKQSHVSKFYAPNISVDYARAIHATYISRGWVVTVKANTYTLNSSWERKFASRDKDYLMVMSDCEVETYYARKEREAKIFKQRAYNKKHNINTPSPFERDLDAAHAGI